MLEFKKHRQVSSARSRSWGKTREVKGNWADRGVLSRALEEGHSRAHREGPVIGRRHDSGAAGIPRYMRQLPPVVGASEMGDYNLLRSTMAADRGRVRALDGAVPRPSQRILHHDGTYTIPRLSNEMPHKPVKRGITSYEYVGQLRYPVSSPAPQGWTRTVSADPEPRDFLEEMFGSLVTDRLGGKWRPRSVNSSRFLRATPMEWIPPNAPTTAIPVGAWSNWLGKKWEQCNEAIDDVVPPAVQGLYVGRAEETLWKGGSRTIIAPDTDFGARRSRIVLLERFGVSGQGTCSATLVAPHKLLTAAHCVTDKDTGDPLDHQDYTVCSYGNKYASATCTTVVGFSRPDEWTGSDNNGKKKWDYAVVETTDDLSASLGTMNLSSSKPGELMKENSFHMAGYALTGSLCTVYHRWPVGQVLSTRQQGALLHEAGDLVFDANPRIIKTHFDFSKGQSGGPIYRCLGGACTPDHPGQIVGVVSGHKNPDIGVRSNAGASVPGHREWIDEQLEPGFGI